MKITKLQFKSLMKECLTELINEGAFDKKLEKIAEAKLKSGALVESNRKIVSEIKSTSEKHPPSKQEIPQNINPRLYEAVKLATSAQPAGRKSLFEEIMLDTAMTTLQNQIANGDGFGATGGLYQNIPISSEVVASDTAQLEALSGGNMSRWATAAFGGNKK